MRDMCLHSKNNNRSFCSQSPLRRATEETRVFARKRQQWARKKNDKSVMGSELGEKAGGTCRGNHKRINDTSEYASPTSYV